MENYRAYKVEYSDERGNFVVNKFKNYHAAHFYAAKTANLIGPPLPTFYRDAEDAEHTSGHDEERGNWTIYVVPVWPEEVESGECWTCDRVFLSATEMVDHVRTEHNREPRNAQEG